MSRWWGYCAVVVAAVTGCRDIHLVEPPDRIVGYRIEGTVTSANGVPLSGVQVRLFYVFESQFYPPRDTARVFAGNTPSTLNYVVRSPEGRIVRRFEVTTSGWVPRNVWDQRDSLGNIVRSGLYTFDVFRDGTKLRELRWLVEGTVSAVTDSAGSFELPNSCFPVGEIVDVFDAQDRYSGTYRIAQEVRLLVVSGTVQRSHFVTVARDTVTRIVITL